FPPKGSQIATWRAISNLRLEKKAVHQTTVLGNLHGGSINAQWLATIITQYSDLLDGEVFRTNAEALKRFGERYMILQALNFAVQDLNGDAKDPNTIINTLMSNLVQQGT
ncbi:MAG TPA: hypothetical protein PLZ51_04850, partial [Aggregatilineales bacterium]|nr:hypothetical protein [Aggregatilineales bacterium]